MQIYFPPPYLGEVCQYKDANTELIKRAVSEFNWQRAFLNTTVDEKVGIFTKILFDIAGNFILHETILCNDKDPPWFNKKIRTLIKEKNRAFNRYRNNSSNLELKRHLKFFQKNLNNSIASSKQIYYCRIANKLNNSQKNSRSYWSLMKIFLNNKKSTTYTSFISWKSFLNRLQGKDRTFQLFLLQTMFPFGHSQ